MEKAQDIAGRIAACVSDNPRHLHRLAAAIRTLGWPGRSLASVMTKKPGTEDKATLWGKESASKSVKTILEESIQGFTVEQKRSFFANLADQLVSRAGEQGAKSVRSQGLIIGRKENYAKPSAQEPTRHHLYRQPSNASAFLATGWLIAETPFFIGSGTEGQKQTDDQAESLHLRTLRDGHGRFRIPFTTIRGVMDKELRDILQAGCAKGRSLRAPCPCQVCTLMRRIQVRDAIAADILPPDLRMRTRIDPSHGTVAHLFSLEMAPQGLKLPFFLKLKGVETIDPDKELLEILNDWSAGQCFLGGLWGTGKGRFRLDDLQWHRLELDNADYYTPLLQDRFFAGETISDLRQGLQSINIQPERIPAQTPSRNMPYCRVDCILEFKSPVLSGDPVAALFESDAPDNVAYKKPVVQYDETGRLRTTDPGPVEMLTCLKGEGVRGVVAYLAGKAYDQHDLSHDSCNCTFCQAFGNGQKAGSLRFDDFMPVQFESDQAGNFSWSPHTPHAMRSDRVALDVFGGAMPEAKFDDRPLAASPGKPLNFKSTIWYREDMGKEAGKALKRALIDLQNNMAAIGSGGGIGRGWVSRVCFEGDIPDFLEDFPEPITVTEPEQDSQLLKNQAVADETAVSACDTADAPHPLAVTLEPGARYFPRVIIPRAPTVKRDECVTGQRYHTGRLSGKIFCELNTLGPLFVPDTDYSAGVPVPISDEQLAECQLQAVFENTSKFNEFFATYPEETVTKLKDLLCAADDKWILAVKDITADLRQEIGEDTFQRIIRKAGHKTQRFHQINDEIGLPGASLRGMVLSNYQILTNSCYRNLKATEEITRRMPADEAKYRKAGRVTVSGDGAQKKYSIQEMEVLRLPIYDNMNTPDNMPDVAKQATTAKRCNNLMNEAAKTSRVELKARWREGQSKIKYQIIDALNKVDPIIQVISSSKQINPNNGKTGWGYVKYTGANVFAKSLVAPIDCLRKKDAGHVCCQVNLNPAWEASNFDILINEKCPVERQSGPRPTLRCKGQDSAWYTLTKRSERIFTDKKPVPDPINIPPREVKRYNELRDSYKKNTAHVPKPLQTFFNQESLANGDLVYFEVNQFGEASQLTPVSISRTTDLFPIGGRLPQGHKDLFPCTAMCLSECKNCVPASFCEFHSRSHEKLCPACSLAGTTGNRGRIKFSEAWLSGLPKWHSVSQDNVGRGLGVTMPRLERSRRTWHLPTKDAYLLGQSIYLNHPVPAILPSDQVPSENNQTVEPLGPKNIFSFQLAFDNLSIEELGLLLYSLELESGMAHRLGRGRALGMGSVQISVKDIQIRDNKSFLFSSNISKKSEWIQCGKDEFAQEAWFGESWDNIDHIQRLRQALTIPVKGDVGCIRYPKLEAEGGMPDYIKLRKRLTPLCDREEPVRYRINPVQLARMILPFVPWHGACPALLNEQVMIEAKRLTELLAQENLDMICRTKNCANCKQETKKDCLAFRYDRANWPC